jgi:hypothetical protein
VGGEGGCQSERRSELEPEKISCRMAWHFSASRHALSSSLLDQLESSLSILSRARDPANIGAGNYILY